MNKLTHRRPARQDRGIAAVNRSRHRHTGMSTGSHCRYFFSIPQFIEHDYFRCESPYGLQNALRLGIPSQHITCRQTVDSRELTPFIHHRHTAMMRHLSR